MAKDFARGEHMMRRPDLQQGQQSDTDQIQNSSQQRGRFQPSWAKSGSGWDMSDDDVLPPIPAHLKTNAWMKRYSQRDFQLDQTPIVQSNAPVPQSQQSGLPPIPTHLKTNAWMKRYSQKDFQLDQSPLLENNQTAQTIAAAPQQQQLAQGSQPQLVAQAQPSGHWDTDYVVHPGNKPDSIQLIYKKPFPGKDGKDLGNKVWPAEDDGSQKGALPINEPIPMGFNGQIVRLDAKGKKITIPFKKGVPINLKPGDQIQQFVQDQPGKSKLTQKQRDEAIKKMSYGDKLVDAAKMVPDLLKGDAKAAYQKMVSDPGFVAQLVAVSAVFAALQATPAGPLIDGALVAYLGFSAGFSLAGYLLKTGSAQNEAGLKSAATDLKDLVEVVGVAGLGAVLGNAGRVLRALQGTSKVAGQVLARNSLIVDENVFIARQKLANGTANAYEKLQLQRLEKIGSDDLRATDSINARLTARDPKFASKGLNLSTKRSSPEYQGLLKELETPVIVKGKLKSGPIGGKTGVDDRNIVADSFFAKTEPGVVPRFATADSKVYNSLAWRAGIKVDQLKGKPLSEAYPNGFNVTINGKTLHVFPLPKK
jgi:hypothetical protein